jgi:hypothetical protein
MPRTVIRVRAQGLKEWNDLLAGMSKRAIAPGPYLQEMIIPDIERIEEQMFLSQGRRGGGSWKRLTYPYMLKKIRLGQNTRINIAVGTMMDSLIKQTDSSIRQIEGDLLTFGTYARGAAQSQKFRPIMRFTAYDRRRWGRLWLQYITQKTGIRV